MSCPGESTIEMPSKDNPISLTDVKGKVFSVDNFNVSLSTSSQSFESVTCPSDVLDDGEESAYSFEVSPVFSNSDSYTSTPTSHYTGQTYDLSNVRRRLFTSFDDLEVNI